VSLSHRSSILSPADLLITAAPEYQQKTVNNYIKNLKGEYDGLYNKTGRAYPDVAAQGNHDVIVWAGNITTIGGTSASSPTFAAVIA